LAEPISQIEMAECFAAMISFAHPLTEDWVGAFLHDSFLTWAARNSTKPSRNHQLENLVLHADAQWTMKHWEEDPEKVALLMLNEFWRVSGIESQPTLHLNGHRWKFAIANAEDTQGCYFDNDTGIVACGDWAHGSRVEGAFLSGMSAAGRVLGMNVSASEDKLYQRDLFGN
jgi:predicted NAD/FAD-dependent oxidoreductase